MLPKRTHTLATIPDICLWKPTPRAGYTYLPRVGFLELCSTLLSRALRFPMRVRHVLLLPKRNLAIFADARAAKTCTRPEQHAKAGPGT